MRGRTTYQQGHLLVLLHGRLCLLVARLIPDPIVIMPATGATVSAVTLANPQIQKKPGIQKTTNVATTTAEPIVKHAIVKHANTSAANTKQSGSADKTKASRLSTQKSETVTNKSRGGGCYLHVVPLVTSFRRLNTPSTCLPWVASRIGGRRDPGG